MTRMALVLVALLAAALPASAEPPRRVVSMNLCTDQLALMLAAPGQVVSVSHWAARPSASNMAAEAARLPLNRGSAEAVFLMDPDLVIAGTFTSAASVAMLRRLGVRVEVFPAAASVADVSAAVRRMGALLGREAAAEALDRRFRAHLAALSAEAAALPRVEGAYHYANNYTSGAGTLEHEIMDRAALDNAPARLGLRETARLDLETLVMLRPFLIRMAPLSGSRTGRAHEGARHPALSALGERAGARLETRWQVCGTPFLTRAVEALIAARTAARAE